MDSVLKPISPTSAGSPGAIHDSGPAEMSVLESRLKHSFGRRELLEQALTHTSQARERDALSPGEPRAVDNEQLEFLGDAVLGFVTAEDLCRRFPNFREGELSKLRAHLVSEKHLIKVARNLGLGEHLRLGKGEEKSGGRKKTTLLVDALEAILAAIYLDGGMVPAREFVVREIIVPEVNLIATTGLNLPISDYKSALQEKLQAVGRAQPAYVLVKENGVEHNKTFTVEARLHSMNDQERPEYIGRASGSTKKSAEQESARQVLEYLASSSEKDNSAKPDTGMS
jgi:ribonuclease III